MPDLTFNRRAFLTAAGAGVAAAGVSLFHVGASRAATRPNVLFICVDDLRPQLACYGKSFMHTPHLDRFAESGVVFNNHFVQVPTCGASRCSLLTSRRPLRDPLLGNGAFDTLPRGATEAPLALPHLFQRAGYRTVSIGKVTHSPNGRRCGKPSGRYDREGRMISSGPDDHAPELAHGWDDVYGPIGAWGDPWSAFFAYAGGKTRSYTEEKSPAVEAADLPDEGYPDGITANEAVKQLRTLKDDPFFLAVGFYKPHLPFCAPKRYWDLYDRDALPLAPHPGPPENVNPALSLHRNGELTGRYAALKDPADATEAEARELRHGYFACVSYVDAQIGKVLDELDRLGLAENTIVSIWGDHGWHLGDLHVWGKHTTFEFSLRSALLMRVPGQTPAGATCDGLVESLDLYPTLAGCCNLDAPADLDGTDWSGQLHTPGKVGKDAAFGYWKRGKTRATTVRTQDARLVEWCDPQGAVVQTEYYDHRADPGETVNVAKAYPDRAEALRKHLHGRV